MTIKYLLFGFLLSPVGQCDTDHGLKILTIKYLLFGFLLSPVGQCDTDHGRSAYKHEDWGNFAYYSAATSADLFFMVNKTVNPYILGANVLYNIVDFGYGLK